MSNNSNVNQLRYSAINTMHHCRLWAYKIYKEKLKGKQNPAARFGTVMHEILEEYALHCIKNKCGTDYSELDIIKFKHIPKLDESQVEDALKVIEVIKDNTNLSSILDFPIFVEERFLLDKDLKYCDNEEDAYFSGGIDLLWIESDIAHVQDWKSVRAIYTNKYMSESLQRKIYSWLVLKRFDFVNEVRFAFNFIRYGYQSPWLSVYREELEDLELQIKAEITALEDLLNEPQEPEGTPGAHCTICPIHGLCDHYIHGYTKLEQVQNHEDAKKLYQEYRLAKVRVKEMEDILKFYVKYNPPITLEYELYGPVVTEDVDFNDTEKVVDVLTKTYEIPMGAIYDVLSFSKTSVNKLLQKFKVKPALRKEFINKYGTTSSVTKIKTTKIEEEKSDEDGDGSFDPYL